MEDNRKHVTQMEQSEVQAVLRAVKARNYTFREHALDRMNQKSVSEAQIKAMLTYCTLIEVHQNIKDDIRVLVRGKVQGAWVCAVVSLINNEVVTVYWNQHGDHHKTLDISQYKAQWNVRDLKL